MSKIKKIGLAGVVLAIVFVVAFICFNRKEKNKIEEKKTLDKNKSNKETKNNFLTVNINKIDMLMNLVGEIVNYHICWD